MDEIMNFVGQPIKIIGESRKSQRKKVAEARLEPWSIIFCSIPHLVQKRREKADGHFLLDDQNKWKAKLSVIQVGSHVSHSLGPSAAFFFGMRFSSF
jgi:hypothetical protein